MKIHDDLSDTQLEKNVSRLVKLADDSKQPGRMFTESLISGVLSELGQSDAGTNRKHWNNTVTISQWEKAAAMIAVVCGAGFGIFVSILAHMNSVFAGIVLIAMLVNWLIYYGGLLL